VNGGTVTLSGWASLKTALTVPEGVTLDLTEEGAALELQDGAVLTVNGTVNATGHGDHGQGWVEGSLRMGDGTAVIAGTGTINLKSKGRLLNIGSDKSHRQLTLDGVTLVGLPDNDHSLVGVHENGELVLKSGAISGNTHVSSEEWTSGGGVSLYGGATFIMEGGEITHNTAKAVIGGNGGGVVLGGSTFIMQGGVISGNTAVGNTTGGGVRLERGSTFIMQGGTISGNSAGGGGGVAVQDNAVFIMEGGKINGAASRLPAGTDVSLANNNSGGSGTTSIRVWRGTANWGIGGTYTIGGIPQTGGSDIVVLSPRGDGQVFGTDDTLIATP
jgi:hypothetical protein